MKTITAHEAKAHLSRYLAAIEQGEEFIIAHGKKPVAMLTPIPKEVPRRRPKVGETLDEQMPTPNSFFEPMTAEEMKQ